MTTNAQPNPLELDAAYKPFPTFEEWQARGDLDQTRWSRYRAELDSYKDQEAGVLKRAREIAKRAAAFDTGAIEGLYEADRGFTYTVAFETTAWEIALAEKGERVRSLFEAQLHAYDYVLDLATSVQPISEAAIRALHETVCAAQDTYRVMTSVGPQEQPLPKGQYKSLPNHVITRSGESHSYAPVDVTPAEVARLVNEVRTDAFQAAHPVRQAAYIHYCFVVIHPFSDGNGRVARALASTFTYKSASIPIVILTEHKTSYLDSLEAADRGDLHAFEKFMMDRSLDTLKLVEESIRSAMALPPEAAAQLIKELYLTKGGYTQDEIDGAGHQVMGMLSRELERLMNTYRSPKLSINHATNSSSQSATATHRPPMQNKAPLLVLFKTEPPVQAQVIISFFLLVPKNAAGQDDIQIMGKNEIFSVRVDEVIPTLSGILQMRVTMFAERTFSAALSQVAKEARKALS